MAWAACGQPQFGMGAIGTKPILRGENEVAAIGDRKLELPGHANRAYLPSAGGRRLFAFAAKDAAAVIHSDRANAVFVTQGDGAGRTCRGRGARIAPEIEVKLRASAKLFGQMRRNARIIGSGGANTERLLEDLEHRVTDPSLNRTS